MHAPRRADDLRAALEAYDRSYQIMRRQEGLSSTGQALILQAKISSLLALGDVETTDALQHSLFAMQQQLLANKPVALARAYLASADWNMKYYLRAWQAPVPGGRTEAQETTLAERLGEARVGVQRVPVAAEAIEQRLVRQRLLLDHQIRFARRRHVDVTDWQEWLPSGRLREN